jgi:hypothetical protein|tara:strand:- start:591 stop:926 length:336 start_codon:yes stop_codon:yes gene_type:complete
MLLGQYGTFNNVWSIVVEVRADKILIIDGDGIKKQIALNNFKPREGNVALRVWYEGAEYLITKSKKIISLTTKKYMKWDDKHPIRRGILAVKGIDCLKQLMKFKQTELPLN